MAPKHPVNFYRVINKEGSQPSWKDVMLNDKPSSTTGITETINLMQYNVPDSNLLLLENQLIGESFNWEDVHTLQQSLNREGVFSVKTIPIGGEMFMLKSDCQEDASCIFNEKEQWWKSIFKEVRCWSPSLYSLERKVWIRCLGVPIHAWSIDFFKAVTISIGEFIKVDSVTEKMEILDFARCFVASKNMGAIDKTLLVSIGYRQWEVRMVEDLGFEEVSRGWISSHFSKEVASDSIDSDVEDEDEWWPEGDSGGKDNEVLGSSEKEGTEEEELDISNGFKEGFTAVAEGKKDFFTNKGTCVTCDGKGVDVQSLKEVGGEKKGEHGDMGWMKEKARKGKGLFLIDLTDIGPIGDGLPNFLLQNGPENVASTSTIVPLIGNHMLLNKNVSEPVNNGDLDSTSNVKVGQLVDHEILGLDNNSDVLESVFKGR
ncbi:unnamed protein product [Lupinus luteus]|uniref:DUF4283 domain-containing protein n=1 Tax=Lupinus luteus TaxID=3873 RepID=A0AAV1Y431_LUPLU